MKDFLAAVHVTRVFQNSTVHAHQGVAPDVLKEEEIEELLEMFEDEYTKDLRQCKKP